VLACRRWWRVGGVREGLFKSILLGEVVLQVLRWATFATLFGRLQKFGSGDLRPEGQGELGSGFQP
jgi:hypothetical protein